VPRFLSIGESYGSGQLVTALVNIAFRTGIA
jgi:hypothetical protein